MLCQSLFFNKVACLKPFFRSENTLFTKHLWVTASGFHKTFCIVVVFLLKRTETLYIWCKAFSFIIFDNYRLKNNLKQERNIFIESCCLFVPSINFHVSLFVVGMFFTPNGRKLPQFSGKRFPVKLL